MVDGNGAWVRQGEGFWRAHHEAWKRSDLNQRQYCEFHGLRKRHLKTGARSSESNRILHNANCSTGVEVLVTPLVLP